MKKIIAMILVIALALSATGCATLEREFKTATSDWTGGLNRTVTLYSYDGQVLGSWSGKMDIADSSYEDEIMFDVNGKRVILRPGIGSVVIQEN